MQLETPRIAVIPARKSKEIEMFLVLAIILAAAWLFGFLIFHTAGFAIHLLLIVAIISVIVHFVKGGSTRSV
jgi:fatty acid desaturase